MEQHLEQLQVKNLAQGANSGILLVVRLETAPFRSQAQIRNRSVITAVILSEIIFPL